MHAPGKTILQPAGIPWLSFLAWCAVIGVVMWLGGVVAPSVPTGGTFLIGALLGNGAFAALLGRR
jgi:hypothetical protein